MTPPPITTTRARSGNATVTRSICTISENSRPVVLHAGNCPALVMGSFESTLSTCNIVELALAVVMEDEQPQERLVWVLREVEHLDVAVGVASPKTGRRPVRFHMRTGFSGPSSK